VKSAVHDILHQKVVCMEDVYRNVYNMVLHKFGDYVYQGLKQVIDENLKEVANRVMESRDDDVFLEELNKSWQNHNTSMGYIRDIFMYMERVHIENNSLPTVLEMGRSLFKDNIASSPQIKHRVHTILLRQGSQQQQGSPIQQIISIFTDLGVNDYSIVYLYV